MSVAIGCVVEGQAEVESVPFLVRRIVQEFDASISIFVPKPVRMTKSKLVKPGELERAVELAARNTRNRGGVLVLLDSDEDCPAQLGPALLARVRAARSDLPAVVVLAKHQFESWFLAGAGSLRGKRRLPDSLQAPEHPEEVSGAKEWLASASSAGRTHPRSIRRHWLRLSTSRWRAAPPLSTSAAGP